MAYPRHGLVRISTLTTMVIVLTLGLSALPAPALSAPQGATTPAVQLAVRAQILARCGPTNCLPAVGPRRGIGCPSGSVRLRPGRRLQAAIDARPGGTAFCFTAGTYRLRRSLLPKSHDVFVGQYGAVLKGSKRVTDWTKRGAYWVATGQWQQNEVVGGVPCRASVACNRPEGLFFGNKALLQVTKLSAVRRGRFFFDYSHDKIYVGSDPSGRRVEASVADGAFRATHHSAKGVVIKNLVIQKFANPSRTGVIYNTRDPGWVIANSAITLNHGAGIVHHDAAQIRNNKIHHNGQLGLIGYRAVGAFVLNNEIARNAIGGFAGWEAGGAKYAGTIDLTFRGNYVHDNQHHGLWTDTDNVNTLYVGNTVVRNKGSGIFHEKAYGCVIRGNYIAHNGADGIFLSSSSNVEVFENSVALNHSGGIHLFIDGATGHDLSDNYIHDNVIRMRDGTSNGITSMNVTDPLSYSISKNNRFRGNSYVVPRLLQPYWYWEDAPKTWLQWQVAGQDLTGTIRLP